MIKYPVCTKQKLPIESKSLDEKYFSSIKNIAPSQTFLSYQVERKRKAEAVVSITKKTFKLFSLKVSICVIRILLTKMTLTKKTPKVAVRTKVSFV